METDAPQPSPHRPDQGRDCIGLHRSGQEIPVEIAISPLETPAGLRRLVIINDISARKQTESALCQTTAQLEEVTYAASHDLRSPLRGIADLLGWIREDLGDLPVPEPVTVNFDRIAQRVERAEQMIDDLLTYAHAGQRCLRQEDVVPALLIADVLAEAAVPERIRVDLDITAAPLTTWRAPLCASLRTLISNAVRHGSREGHPGHLRITARDEGRYVVFHVEDDGPGIPDMARERIFRLFHPVTSTGPGYGVGLAVTRRLIKAHDGLISVTGHGALGGACFTVHWPRYPLHSGAGGGLP